MTPHPRTFRSALRDVVSSPYIQGLAAVAGLIAAIASDSPWVRVPALVVLLGFVFSLRSFIASGIRNFLAWLTWKFALGLAIGVLVTFLLVPFLEPIYKVGVSFVGPQVEVVDTSPRDGGQLKSTYSPVEVNFSSLVPPSARSSKNLWVELSPDFPIRLIWTYEFDPDECCRTLFIEPARYFPGERRPQFEPNKTYSLRIGGLLVKNPVDMTIRTPAN